MPWVGALVFDGAGHNGPVAAPSGDTTDPTAPHTTIAVHVSGDEYQGSPEFRLLVDGQQVGGIHTVTADHALGQWQTVNFDLDASIPLNDIRVEFLNDAYGGSADKDRNLYVDSIEVNGARLLSQDAIYDRNGASDLPGQTIMPWVGALVFDAADHNLSAGTLTANKQTVKLYCDGGRRLLRPCARRWSSGSMGPLFLRQRRLPRWDEQP